jgi:hypothetical protein
MRKVFTLIYYLVSLVTAIILVIISLLPLAKRKTIIFGTTPIINNKYWSLALRELGFDTTTLMSTFYDSINKKNDYDVYFDDVIPVIFKMKYFKELVKPFCVWFYIIRNAKIVVMPFHGLVFLKKYLWKIELVLLKLNGIKTIVLAYGADAYIYSKVKDTSLQNALLISYPNGAKDEKEISEKVFFWSKYADFTASGFMSCDGIPRWDIAIHQYTQINTKEWVKKNKYSMNNGKNGIVKILHAPNHKGFKGTEFIMQAVDELKQEGLKLELILLEKVSNEKVKQVMQEVDILVEQLIANAYALTGIEGMASGLPVMSNLENDSYTNLYRRYSFLNECPIVSTSPETIKENLRLLIINPKLRKELGSAGREFVEKYHSFEMAQYFFGSIFKKFDGEDIDLMNLFHPIMGEYPKRKPFIKHPLVKNRITNI